jgi:hypothetical protein
MQQTPQPIQETFSAKASASTAAGDKDRVGVTIASQPEPVIWTPPFIIFFFTLFMLGLGLASLCCYAWTNSTLIVPARLFLFYAGIAFLCWLAVIIFGRSPWVRVGGIGAALWAFFGALQYYLQLHGLNPQSTVALQLNIVTICSLLAASLALSYARTRGSRWDTILGWLIPLCICAYMLLNYRKVPVHTSTLLFLEGKLVTLAMLLAVIVWFFRPANWREQPGLTLLFSISILIIYALTRMGPTTENTIFFQQVVFVLLIVSAVRVFQGERRLGQRTPGQINTVATTQVMEEEISTLV